MSIPDIWIERVHLGEGTAAMSKAVHADPDARAKLEALSDANAAFHARIGADEQLAAIERKLHVARTADAVKSRSGWRPLVFGLVPAAAAVAALLVAVPPSSQPTAPPLVERGDDVRIKIKPGVMVYQRTDKGPKKVKGGEALAEGAELQLGYKTADPHGVLLSVDGRGTVTVHHPDNGNSAIDVGYHMLDHGYRLDDAPRFERFFLVMSDAPLSVDAIVDAAEAVGDSNNPLEASLSAPDGAEVVDFTIKKVSR